MELFDRYARNYDSTVDASIRASGESVEYFAWLKARLLVRDASTISEPRILDFGCGVGNLTRALAELWPSADVTGCDPSAESIACALNIPAPNGASASFVGYDGDKLPFEDCSFDIVCASCVFHHIERVDHDHWMREVRRVLRPGGRLYLFEHNPYNPLTLRAVRSCPFDEGVTLLEPSYATSLLRRNALQTSGARFYFFFPAALASLRRLEPVLAWLPLGAQYFTVGVRDDQVE